VKPIARVQLGKHLCDVFPIRNGWKQGDALSQLRICFALDYAIRRVQGNQDGFKLSDTHQVLVYAYKVNILGGSIYTLKKKYALLFSSGEIGLEVNADKTKYIVVS
jgi:hypothetical protein